METIKNLNNNFPVISGFAAVIITLMLLVFVTGTTKLINIPTPDIGPKLKLIEYTKPPEPLPPPQEVIVQKPVEFMKTDFSQTPLNTPITAAPPDIQMVDRKITGSITLSRTKPDFKLTPPVVSDILDPGNVDLPPRILRPVNPIYPFEAKRAGIEGKVTLRFVVDENGMVQNPEILKAEPEGVFDEAALAAILKYRFVPAKLDGEPVKCYAALPIGFRLE